MHFFRQHRECSCTTAFKGCNSEAKLHSRMCRRCSILKDKCAADVSNLWRIENLKFHVQNKFVYIGGHAGKLKNYNTPFWHLLRIDHTLASIGTSGLLLFASEIEKLCMFWSSKINFTFCRQFSRIWPVSTLDKNHQIAQIFANAVTDLMLKGKYVPEIYV